MPFMGVNRVQGLDLFINRNRVYEGTTDVMNAYVYLSQFIAKGKDRSSIASAVPFAPDLPPWRVATDPSIPLGYMKYVHVLVGGQILPWSGNDGEICDWHA